MPDIVWIAGLWVLVGGSMYCMAYLIVGLLLQGSKLEDTGRHIEIAASICMVFWVIPLYLWRIEIINNDSMIIIFLVPIGVLIIGMLFRNKKGS